MPPRAGSEKSRGEAVRRVVEVAGEEKDGGAGRMPEG